MTHTTQEYNNREIMLDIVKNSGLKYASDELKNDREIVLEAIKQDGRSLEYASDELKNDREIVLEAIKQDGWNLRFSPLKENKELIYDFYKLSRCTIDVIPEYLHEHINNKKKEEYKDYLDETGTKFSGILLNDEWLPWKRGIVLNIGFHLKLKVDKYELDRILREFDLFIPNEVMSFLFVFPLDENKMNKDEIIYGSYLYYT